MEFYDSPVPQLATERLYIRRFASGDLTAFHRVLLGDPDWWDTGTVAEAGRKMDYYIHQTENNNPPLGYRGVFLRDSGALIGTVGYESYFLGPAERALFEPQAAAKEAPHRQLEFGLGYFIAAQYRGRGYATEAVRALIDYAFTAIKVPRLWAETWHENTASVKLMEAVGMRIGRNPDPEAWPGIWGVVDNHQVSSHSA